MSRLKREIELHKKIYRDYKKRYSPCFAQEYLQWWDELIIKPLGQTSKGRILDCGCGTGYLSLKIGGKRPEATVIGLDPSKEMLSLASPSKNVHFKVGNATELPFKSGFFEAIVCKEALHHVDKPQKAVKEFYRTLKPGGLLMLSDPCSDSFLLQTLRKIFFAFSKKFDPNHGSFGKNEVRKILERNGFRVLEQFRVGYIAYPLCGMADILPLFEILAIFCFNN